MTSSMPTSGPTDHKPHPSVLPAEARESLIAPTLNMNAIVWALFISLPLLMLFLIFQKQLWKEQFSNWKPAAEASSLSSQNPSLDATKNTP